MIQNVMVMHKEQAFMHTERERDLTYLQKLKKKHDSKGA